MKQKLEQIINLLRTAVPKLARVEFEAGQTDAEDLQLSPVLTFPCAFVDISYPDCVVADDQSLQCGIEVAVRVAFRAWGGDGRSTPETFLAGLDLVDEVAAQLDGWTDGTLCPLEFMSQTPETRADGLKVYDLRFVSSFEIE